MRVLKQEGWHVQNASIPSNSIPQAAMRHLSAAGQGAVMLPNGAVAMVRSPAVLLTMSSIDPECSDIGGSVAG